MNSGGIFKTQDGKRLMDFHIKEYIPIKVEEVEKVEEPTTPKKGLARKRTTTSKERMVDEVRTIWDSNKELSWLNRILPNVNKQGLLSIHEGLIQLANNKLAWGLFSEAGITLSNIAAEGTTYHEAFHLVFSSMLSDKQQASLYREARTKYGKLSIQELEERMAEDFRNYVSNKSLDETLGTRIKNFFKTIYNIFSKKLHTNPTMEDLFNSIQEGKFSNTPIEIKAKSDFESLSTSAQAALMRRGYTSKLWDYLTQEEKDHAKDCMGI